MIKKRRQHLEKIRVGEVLVQKGVISKAQLQEALLVQKTSSKKLGEILIEQQLVTRAQLRQALSKQHWHNVAVTFLLMGSALAAGLPKLISAELASAGLTQKSNDTNSLTHDLSIGGANNRTINENLAQSSHFPYVTASLPKNPTVKAPLKGFCHPMQGKGWLSQGIRGTTHQGRMEYAYDLGTNIGTPVYAMRAGKVIGVQDKYPDTGGGRDKMHKFNYVFVQHDGGYRSVYVHLQQGFRQKTNIRSGDWVKSGQLIGYSGNSGWSSGPHLHVEVQKPGNKSRFTQTVPFSITGTCDDKVIANQT